MSTTVSDGPLKSEVRDGMRIDWDAPIAMSDGVILRADVYRPVEDGEYPVIASYGPYAKNLSFQEAYSGQWNTMVAAHPEVAEGTTANYEAWEVCDPEKWVPHGYAVVRVDSRGAARSPGRIDCFNPQETQDFYECIEWAGTQPWSNGKVGLSGVSYYAVNQWQVAALAPPHLAAICPWEGAADWYRDANYHGGVPSPFLGRWYPVQVEDVQHGLAERGPRNPVTGMLIAGDIALSQEELDAQRGDIMGELRAHPLLDDYWRDRTADLSKITTPLLSAGNWGGQGLHLRGNIGGYLESASTQKWLEIHGELHWTLYYSDYGVALQRRFFDHFLKGTDNGWDRTARVQLKVRTPEGFVRRDEHEWPLARTRWARLYLDLACGGLADVEPRGSAQASFAARRDTLVFRTSPVTETLEITGPAALKLFVSSSTDDADLFVTVHLFDPDGQEVLFATAFEPRAPLTQGWLRMSHRALDPQRSDPYRPWHPHDRLEPLKPGHTYEADVEIWPTSIIAPTEYSLGVSVRGVDYVHGLPGKHHVAYGRELLGSGPYWHEHPGDRDRTPFDGTTTLHSEPGRRPYLLLPVIPESG
jgi:predicted acyl esterase